MIFSMVFPLVDSTYSRRVRKFSLKTSTISFAAIETTSVANAMDSEKSSVTSLTTKIYDSFLSKNVYRTEIDRVEPKLWGFTCVTLILGHPVYQNFELLVMLHIILFWLVATSLMTTLMATLMTSLITTLTTTLMVTLMTTLLITLTAFYHDIKNTHAWWINNALVSSCIDVWIFIKQL